jgi:hypothetical protein
MAKERPLSDPLVSPRSSSHHHVVPGLYPSLFSREACVCACMCVRVTPILLNVGLHPVGHLCKLGFSFCLLMTVLFSSALGCCE